MMKKIRAGVIAGAFDVLHPGYIRLFKEAADSCDKLTVLLHSDPSIERPTKLKPILSVNDRIEMLLHLRSVDLVEVYTTEADLLNLLTRLNPDVRFMGDDYIDASFTGDSLDIDIHYINRNHGWSTTKYKKSIKESYESIFSD